MFSNVKKCGEHDTIKISTPNYTHFEKNRSNRQKPVKIDENRLKSRENKKKRIFFLVFLFDNHVWARWIVSHENYWVMTNISIF